MRFLLYGAFGWCAEIVWTAVTDSIEARLAKQPLDVRLVGRTYLWMFPIYGLGGLLFEVVHAAIAVQAWPVRGLIYMLGCFAVEYVSGWLIRAVSGACPWDYSHRRWHVQGLIRLDYAPVWFVFGLLLEVVERYVNLFAAAAT
ncbi:MAG TPA: hypothetical protein VEB21_20475 [Terriglobales bacterium]|nr:hypothetical protein [Terriglobales bacterium]